MHRKFQFVLMSLLLVAPPVFAKKKTARTAQVECAAVSSKAKKQKAGGVEKAAIKLGKRVDGIHRKCERIIKKLNRALKAPLGVQLSKGLKIGPAHLKTKPLEVSAKRCDTALVYAKKLKNPQAVRRLEAQVKAIQNIGRQCRTLRKRLRR